MEGPPQGLGHLDQVGQPDGDRDEDARLGGQGQEGAEGEDPPLPQAQGLVRKAGGGLLGANQLGLLYV